MAKARYLTDEDGNRTYAVSHIGAVYDGKGAALEKRLDDDEAAIADKAEREHTHTRADIEDFPETIPPGEHTHEIDEVNGLRSELDENAAAIEDVRGAITDIESGNLPDGAIGADKVAGVEFTEAASRTNITSGEKLGALFGKIRKWFADLKTVAFTGSYTDLTDKPTLFSGSYDDLTNKPTIPTQTSQLTNNSDFQTGTQVSSAIQTAISKTGHASFKKVDALPSYSSAESNVLYLLKNTNTGKYDIYAKVDGSTQLELLDDTTVDLSAYSTTAQMNAALAGKSNTGHTHSISDVSSLQSALDGKLSTAGGTITGDLKLKGSGNYGNKLNFGDSDYVYLYEDTDDHLIIKGDKGVDINTNSNGVKVNGAVVSTAGHTHTKANITDFPSTMANPYSLSLTMNGSATSYNGASAQSKTWYAPTGAGMAGYELVSNGSGAPVWKQPSYAICTTAAGTRAKTVSVTNFKLVTGVHCYVKFSYANTVSGPTLNVNSTTAANIRYNGAYIASDMLKANIVYDFVYDGAYWNLVGELPGKTGFPELKVLTSSDDCNKLEDGVYYFETTPANAPKNRADYLLQFSTSDGNTIIQISAAAKTISMSPQPTYRISKDGGSTWNDWYLY